MIEGGQATSSAGGTVSADTQVAQQSSHQRVNRYDPLKVGMPSVRNAVCDELIILERFLVGFAVVMKPLTSAPLHTLRDAASRSQTRICRLLRSNIRKDQQ